MIENSVIGLRTRIGKNVTIRDSVILGQDFYEEHPGNGKCITMGIGDGSVIERAIVDKHCRIGRNVRVVNSRKLETSDETPEYMIVDGIVCVQRGAVLGDGWKLE